MISARHALAMPSRGSCGGGGGGGGGDTMAMRHLLTCCLVAALHGCALSHERGGHGDGGTSDAAIDGGRFICPEEVRSPAFGICTPEAEAACEAWARSLTPDHRGLSKCVEPHGCSNGLDCIEEACRCGTVYCHYLEEICVRGDDGQPVCRPICE